MPGKSCKITFRQSRGGRGCCLRRKCCCCTAAGSGLFAIGFHGDNLSIANFKKKTLVRETTKILSLSYKICDYLRNFDTFRGIKISENFHLVLIRVSRYCGIKGCVKNCCQKKE